MMAIFKIIVMAMAMVKAMGTVMMMTMAMVKGMVDLCTNALLILILNIAIMHLLNSDDHDDGVAMVKVMAMVDDATIE